MALLEGDERSEMPSMSWKSVVKRPTAPSGLLADLGDDSEEDDSSPSARPADGTVVAAAPERPLTEPSSQVAPTAPQPTTRQPVTADGSPSPAPSRSLPSSAPAQNPPAPVQPATASPAPAPDATEAVPVSSSAPTRRAVAKAVPAESSPAEPAVPTIVESATPAPPVLAPFTASTAPTEPAQVQQTSAAVEASPHADVDVPVPAIDVAPATQPNQAISLPSVVPTTPPAVHRDAVVKASQPRKARKDRSGSIARVGFFFLVVGALVSAAVIFGRPYLFPADWEDEALEFAQPIETARGSEFAEPVLLTPQPSGVHRQMVFDQLLGDPAANMPMWRALGLAGSDSTDDATLQMLISEQSPVLYSTADGQVYYDSTFTRSDRATLISQAMATAALDQEYAFSTEAPNRSMDDAALADAHLLQQTSLLAESATERPPVPGPDMATLAFLPAVLDYRLTAPEVFAELLAPINDVAPNPLADLGPEGPGPLTVAPLNQIPSESVVADDVAAGAAIVTDRSFWYMSFASHLDAATAYRMSNELQSAGLQMVDGPSGTCAVATLSATDVATNAALQADLGTWVAATAPEMAATVTALADSSVQLRSCDPAGEFSSNIRFGVARELIAWRAIELAVTNGLISQGASAADVESAVAAIGSIPSALAAAQLPAGTAPGDLAAAAQIAATDVLIAETLPPDPDAPIDPAADEAALEPAPGES